VVASGQLRQDGLMPPIETPRTPALSGVGRRGGDGSVVEVERKYPRSLHCLAKRPDRKASGVW